MTGFYQMYSPFWPGVPNALITRRLSATGPRTFATLIASSDGGAGGFRRVYKFIQFQEKLSPSDFYFKYLGGNRERTSEFYNLFSKNRSY